jgi:GGDEF domain-containing protein
LRKLQRELKEQHVQAEVFRRLAMFDPLTGLCNRRFAEQRLKAGWRGLSGGATR